MSDSLNATVIVSVFVLTISANPELDPELPEEPDAARLPAVVPVPDELLEIRGARCDSLGLGRADELRRSGHRTHPLFRLGQDQTALGR